MELRPLGFGEIFDRAVTLYVRNFPSFFAIVLVLIVPLGIVQYFVDASQSAQLDAFVRVLRHPGAAPAVPQLFSSPGDLVTLLLVVAAFYVLWPFALDAVAVGVARLYRNRPVDFAACYRAVLSRWPAILGTLALQAAIVIAWYVAFVVVVFVSILVAAVFARAWLPLGVVGFALAIAVSLAALAILAPVFIALTFAMNAVVIERRGPIDAIASGFGRIFTRDEFWRSLLFAVAALAVLVGGSIVVAVVAWAALLVHAIALEVVVDSLLRAAFAPFSIVLIAVYYFDVRIRREGFDLEAELEQLAPPVAATT